MSPDQIAIRKTYADKSCDVLRDNGLWIRAIGEIRKEKRQLQAEVAIYEHVDKTVKAVLKQCNKQEAAAFSSSSRLHDYVVKEVFRRIQIAEANSK